MKTSTKNNNCLKSNAHFLLLRKFLHPTSINEFSKADYWNDVLGESVELAIENFLDDELLLKFDLTGQLDYKFKNAELKNMLKDRDLKQSGRKEELITRLIEADQATMENLVRGLKIFLCSEEGRIKAEQHLAEEHNKRVKLNEQISELIKQRNFEEASKAVASFEAEQVFPRGLGISWKNHNPKLDIVALNAIFSFVPKILRQVSDEVLDSLRYSAAMNYLWGTNKPDWLPTDFENNLEIGNETLIGMFLHHAYFHRSLENYQQDGVVTEVQILSTKCCETCMKLSNIKFTINSVPQLPYEHCIREDGCNCIVLPIVPGVNMQIN